MAQTNTETKTNTISYARVSAIRNQFGYAFKKICNYNSDEYEPFLTEIKNKKIDHIAFWGYKYNDVMEKEKWCELIIYIDWNKHNKFILSGNDIIAINSRWNGVLPETELAVDTIVDVINEFGLIPTFSVMFIDSITHEEHDCLRKKLGLVKGSTVRWHGTKQLLRERQMPEIPEIRSEFYVSKD